MDTVSCDSGLPGSSRSSVDEQIGDDVKTGMCGLSDLVSSCLSKRVNSVGNEQNIQPFLQSSLFSDVPPTIRFYTKGTKVSKPTKKILSRLTWCHNSLLPIVMRQSLSASHFTIVDESQMYIGYWGRHLKSVQYRTMYPYQKINHYPGAFHIGRKDRLWMNIQKQQERFGDEFDILPTTYILPKDKDDLLEYLDEDPRHCVILKPPASARGTGITVTRKLKDIPMKNAIIAQHYVDRPLTINGTKFDLRLYVYVPSLDPLRIYLYDEGLVRFASVPYSKNISHVSNKYMHLTNYSINKLAEQDGVLDSPVAKWTLSQLWVYFEQNNIDVTDVRMRIEDIIVKAFISCERPIREHMAKHVQHGFICHELFGVDILLDEDLRPWLLEVNISPSLHSGTPLDIGVKAPLAKNVLNMAGIYVPPPPEEVHSADYCSRPKNGAKTDEQIMKETAWVNAFLDENKLNPRILKRLTPEDTRILVDFEDEYNRRGNFYLVYPVPEKIYMLKYFSEPLYSNLLLNQWQINQSNDRTPGVARLESLCKQGHMKIS